jgi:hypothetical protein
MFVSIEKEVKMIEILDSPKHLVAIRLAGDLTAEDVSKAWKAVEDGLKENERISFFAEIDPSMKLTFEGLAKDVAEGIRRLGRLSKYYRAAVVTDKGWMAALARAEGVVFSSIDLRVFEPADRNKALAWASETPEPLPKPEEPKASIHFLQTTSENVFAYEVDGRLREKDVKAAVAELKPYLEREGKINVLARMKNFSGFDILSVLDDDLIRLKFKAPAKIERYAIVGAKPWLRNLLELFDPLVKTEIRTFDASEEDAAWEWVGARQALLAGK